jgi:hypothetical protein
VITVGGIQHTITGMILVQEVAVFIWL